MEIAEVIASGSAGAPGGVATLNSSGELVEKQLPSSVVSDSRGLAAGDLLLFNGASFLRFPKGSNGQIAMVCSDGTIRYENAPRISLDAWVLSATGNITAKLEEAIATAKAQGGTVFASAKEYIVDGWVLTGTTNVEGANDYGSPATIFRAESGSANEAQVTLATGYQSDVHLKNIAFLPNGNATQECMHLRGVEGGTENTGGLSDSTFENIQFGRKYSEKSITGSWGGHCIWFQGGPISAKCPMQYIQFRNCSVWRQNTGAQATINRCLKMTGQCEKIYFDAGTYFNGEEPSERVGTNVELSREFLYGTTLSAEALKGATTLELKEIPSGLEANKVFSVGEGAANELAEVASIAGTKVTLKSALKFTHVTLTRMYLLSGTVSEPAKNAPQACAFMLGTNQNAELGVLVDAANNINWYGTDWENMPYCVRARAGAANINVFDAKLSNAGSEGTGYAVGTATVGSTTLEKVQGTWTVGEKISGPGVPAGATVTSIEGTTLTISSPVQANGTEGPATIPLAQGGEGGGYLAKYEEGAWGEAGGYAYGIVDHWVMNDATSGGRVSSRVAQRLTSYAQTSLGTTLVTATSAVLTINRAREVVLSNAGTVIKTMYGRHATGETVRLRATVAGTVIEKGGNITIAAGSVTLGVGDVATFLRSDDSANLTWVLVGVHRAEEELVWREIEELNEHLEPTSGYAPKVQYAVQNGLVYLSGTLTLTATLTGGTQLFKIPNTAPSARPAHNRLLVVPYPGASVPAEITINTSGVVANVAELKSGNKIGVDGHFYPIAP